MLKSASALFVVATLAVGPAWAQADQAKALSCAQSLGLVKTETDTLVVGERGPDSVLLASYDPTGPSKVESDIEVRVFDVDTCQLVEVDLWVQDKSGASLEQGKGPVARFSSNLFGGGERELRSNRATDRDMGFIVGFVK